MAFIHKEFGFNKVLVMHQDVAWARATANGIIKNYFEKSGWTVLGQEAYPTGASDFSSGLMKAQSGGAQVILPIFDMASSAVLVKQWNSMKVPALVAGFISPLAGPSAWKTFDQKIGGAINVNFELGSAIASKKWPKSWAFEQAFEKKYKRPLDGGHGEAPSYDAVYILKEAIERAGSLNADAIVAALEKTDYSESWAEPDSITVIRPFSAWIPKKPMWPPLFNGRIRGGVRSFSPSPSPRAGSNCPPV